MRKIELREVVEAIASAVRETVEELGLEALKRTSFFASNEREDVAADMKKAA